MLKTSIWWAGKRRQVPGKRGTRWRKCEIETIAVTEWQFAGT